jgi:hypothetical protein
MSPISATALQRTACDSADARRVAGCSGWVLRPSILELPRAARISFTSCGLRRAVGLNPWTVPPHEPHSSSSKVPAGGFLKTRKLTYGQAFFGWANRTDDGSRQEVGPKPVTALSEGSGWSLVPNLRLNVNLPPRQHPSSFPAIVLVVAPQYFSAAYAGMNAVSIAAFETVPGSLCGYMPGSGRSTAPGLVGWEAVSGFFSAVSWKRAADAPGARCRGSDFEASQRGSRGRRLPESRRGGLTLVEAAGESRVRLRACGLLRNGEPGPAAVRDPASAPEVKSNTDSSST